MNNRFFARGEAVFRAITLIFAVAVLLQASQQEGRGRALPSEDLSDRFADAVTRAQQPTPSAQPKNSHVFTEPAFSPTDDVRSIEEIFEDAQIAIESGHFADARANLEGLLGTYPQHAEALIELSRLRASIDHDPDEAAKLLVSALYYNPEHRDAAEELVGVIRKSRNFDIGLNGFAEVLSAHPEESHLHYHYASLLGKVGRVGLQLAHLKESVRLADSPEKERVLAELAATYRLHGYVNDAATAMKSWLELKNEFISNREILGYNTELDRAQFDQMRQELIELGVSSEIPPRVATRPEANQSKI